MIAVWKKELSSYFKGMMGYLIAAFLLLFVGIYTRVYNLSGYYANFEYALESVSFVYLLIIPLLTMRSVAEERKQKTDQLLYSLPISLTKVVIGKYLAMVFVLFVPVAVMCSYPLILSRFGTVSFATAYGSILAFFLLGAALIAMGLFISSVTENQITAAVISLMACLLLYFMTGLASLVSTEAAASFYALCALVLVFGVVLFLLCRNLPVSVLVTSGLAGGLYFYYQANSEAFSGLFATMMEKISIFERFYTFVNGIFDLTAVVYFLSIILVFLFLSVQAMEKRRWNE